MNTLSRSIVSFLILSLSVVSIFAQEVTGKIVYEDNTPLVGATIIIKRSPRGTASDARGEFKITAAAGDTLLFFFVGFLSQEYPVDSLPQVIRLEEDRCLTENESWITTGGPPTVPWSFMETVAATGRKQYRQRVINVPDQRISVIGKITNEKNEPLSEAVVGLKGYRCFSRSYAQPDGRYRMVALPGDTLVFRCSGYESQWRVVRSDRLDVALLPKPGEK